MGCGACKQGSNARTTWDGRSYYVCRGHNAVIPERRCRPRHVPAVQLDELVWEDLCKLLTHPERIRNALQRAHAGEWLPQEFKARLLKTMDQAIAHVERQKRRLLDAYLSGVLELPELERKCKELGERSESLLAQKRQLEASANERMELAKIADSIERFCEQVRSGLAKATFEHRRALVELLVDQVVVTNEEVEIRYVVPTSPEGPHHPFCHLRTDYLDGLPGREVVGQQAPGAAATQDVENGVEDLAGVVDLGTPGGLGGGQVVFEATPFGVGEVGLVCFSHAR